MVQKWIHTLIGILAAVSLISCEVEREGTGAGTDTTIENQQQTDDFGVTDDTDDFPDVSIETQESDETVIEDERSPASVDNMENNMNAPEDIDAGETEYQDDTQYDGTGTEQ